MTATSPQADPGASDSVPVPDEVVRGGILGAVPVGPLLVGLLGALLIACTAPAWQHAPPDLWRLTIPGVAVPDGSSFLAGALFVVGVVLMTGGWLWLLTSKRSRARGERKRMFAVLACLVLWGLPLFLGPPLLSSDIYSYAAQGELQSRGIDPTAHGPTYLLGGDYLVGADPYWRNDPAPYGPVWVGLSDATVEITDHDAALSIWGFRLLAVAGVAMAAVGVALIARSYGLSSAGAVALGIANPLVLIHLVGGGHNDALMLGFLALGLAAVRKDHRVLGVVLVALAAAVKLPAAVALPFIGWTWPGVRDRFVNRALAGAATLFGGGALVAVLCVFVGIGGGWVFALSGTNRVHSTFSATTKVGHVAHDLISLIGLELDQGLVVNIFRGIGLLAALVVAVVVLLRSPQLGVVRSVAFVLLAVVLLGPVVWPWYLPAGLALLAASGVGRFKGPFVVIVFATSLFVFPTSVDTVLFLLSYEHLLGLGVVVVVAGPAVLSYRLPWGVWMDGELPSSAMHAPTEPPSSHGLDSTGSARRAPSRRS